MASTTESPARGGGSRESPYERVLGGRLSALHPQLVAYFGVIPLGRVGRGVGTFSVVGTPRRWLRPLIALFVPRDVLFPVWEEDVPFTITNIPGTVGGRPAVRSVRVFELSTGPRVMRDVIWAREGELIDDLGERRRFGAAFIGAVEAGELRLRSHRVWMRFRRLRIPVPRALSPVVTVAERAANGRAQRVSVTVDAPLLGRVYEYTGTFTYGMVDAGGHE